MQTVQDTTPRFYELKWSLEHLIGDLEYDVWLKNASEGRNVRDILYNGKALNSSEPIEFESLEENLISTDYPYNDKRFPIMSKRMLDVLLSIRNFSYQAIPIVIIDTTGIYVEGAKNYVRSGIKNYSFSLMRIPECLDVFDWENSIYQPDSEYPGEVELHTAKKIVLKEPEEGFPPLFRVSAMPYGSLLISAEAKATLEAADIRGVRFSKLLKY
jgi:hypothetical protein